MVMIYSRLEGVSLRSMVRDLLRIVKINHSEQRTWTLHITSWIQWMVSLYLLLVLSWWCFWSLWLCQLSTIDTMSSLPMKSFLWWRRQNGVSTFFFSCFLFLHICMPPYIHSVMQKVKGNISPLCLLSYTLLYLLIACLGWGETWKVEGELLPLIIVDIFLYITWWNWHKHLQVGLAVDLAFDL